MSGSTRSKSSDRWMREHHKDPYVLKSREDGYRSRASYKLLELDRKDRFFRPGQTVVDLGAAPGGWSQVAVERVGHKGLVVASDILEMDAIAGVRFLQGDFTQDAVLEELLTLLDGQPVDLVISDMAPNMSGVAAVDIPASMHLVELALDFAGRVLRPGGGFVGKVFQGEGFQDVMNVMKSDYGRVVTRKPDASRGRSREQYQVCTGFHGG